MRRLWKPISEVKPVLKVDRVSVFYGKAIALKEVSLRIEKGELVTLLGANGAGKSTLLKALSGIQRPRQGRILLEDEEIQKLPPHQIVKRGIIQVPEGRELFPDLTVYENLWMGSYLREDTGAVKEDLDFVFKLFPRLEERKSQTAGTLSGGEGQMLAIARGLLSAPKILMLDEPSLGIAPLMRDNIFQTVLKIYKEKGMTLLLVEQNAKWALSVSSRGYILENGAITLEGKGSDLAEDDYVKKAYLGY
jgi:branched-chain amino acid transport system ATP-binding protein